MFNISVNFTAVLAAAIANMVLGFVWYGPLFGKQWVAMMGWSKEEIEAGMAKMKKEGWKTYLLAFIGSLLMGCILARMIIFVGAYFSASNISIGLITGFWGWVGFVVPITLSTVLWEGRSWKLWFLNSSYYFVALLLMGAILSVWM